MQVRLTERQVRKLRGAARKRGVSVAEVIRRCVETALSSLKPDLPDPYSRAARLAGKFPDRRSAKDLARRHDSYLDEAFE